MITTYKVSRKLMYNANRMSLAKSVLQICTHSVSQRGSMLRVPNIAQGIVQLAQFLKLRSLAK